MPSKIKHEKSRSVIEFGSATLMDKRRKSGRTPLIINNHRYVRRATEEGDPSNFHSTQATKDGVVSGLARCLMGKSSRWRHPGSMRGVSRQENFLLTHGTFLRDESECQWTKSCSPGEQRIHL